MTAQATGTEPTPTKRRVQSEAVRREQILTAARDLIAEQGYERTTTAQIARRAGISEGTIYNYFASKVAVVTALKEQATTAVMDGAFARAVPGLFGGALIRAMLEGTFAAARANADLMQAFSLNVELRDMLHPICPPDPDFHAARIAEFFAVQQGTGLIPASVDITSMARLMLGTVNFALEECFSNGQQDRAAIYIDLMVRMFSRALYVE